jgi:hypothetical protein
MFGGVGVTVVLYVSGSLLGWAGPSSEEFGASKGSAVLWALESIGILAALTYLFSTDAGTRLSSSRRGFLLGLCFVTLGGMGLCDVLAVPVLFEHRS